jgi:hypothetical protein
MPSRRPVDESQAERSARWLGPSRAAAVDGREASRLAERLLRPAERHALEERLRAAEARIEALEAEVARLAGPMPSSEEEVRPRPAEPIDVLDLDRPGSQASLAAALRHCAGFTVESPSGRLGRVEGLRYGSSADCPDLLEVRRGLFGQHLWLLPVGDVERVVLAQERVVVRASESLDEALGGRLAAERSGSGDDSSPRPDRLELT